MPCAFGAAIAQRLIIDVAILGFVDMHIKIGVYADIDLEKGVA